MNALIGFLIGILINFLIVKPLEQRYWRKRCYEEGLVKDYE